MHAAGSYKVDIKKSTTGRFRKRSRYKQNMTIRVNLSFVSIIRLLTLLRTGNISGSLVL